MDVNSKLMLQAKCKSSIGDDKPKKKSHKYSDAYLDFGSRLSCKTVRNNLSALFATRYWPVRVCYRTNLNDI